MEFIVPTIKEIHRIKDILKDNKKDSCEMSPANTILWANHYNTKICFYNNQLVYRSQADEGGYSYSCNLHDAKNPKDLLDFIIQQAKEDQTEIRMHCITNSEWNLIEQCYPNRFVYKESRGSSDYVYSREKLANLSGKKLHGKRNHIHRFEENNPDWRYETISNANEKECEHMAMKWCIEQPDMSENEINYDKITESKLVVYAIRHRKELGMIGGALRVDGEIIAITLGERLTDDTFVVHFEKAYSDIQGAYPMINREFVRHELEKYDFVNREEDLGIEGLRKAKLSYYPEKLIIKGNVTERK